MAERTMTEDRLEIVMLSCPHAKIETKDGKEYVVIDQYDANTDLVTEYRFLLIRRPATPTREDFTPARPVRSGPVANFSKWLYGQVYERPDGQTFKVVPPPKDEDDVQE